MTKHCMLTHEKQPQAQKEKERMAKTLASQRELKKKKETRREKLSREWAEEMQAFDRAIDIRAQEEAPPAADFGVKIVQLPF